MTSKLVTAFVALWCVSAAPPWENPKNGLRLIARDVFADPKLPLPKPGEATYVFTARALRRGELDELQHDGLRYLGVVSANVYAFLVERSGIDLQNHKQILGTSPIEPNDRLELDVLPWLTKSAAQLPRALRVGFYPRATKRELLQLIPANVLEHMRLPRDQDEPIREERHLLIPFRDSTPSLLRALAKSPLVGRAGFDHPRISHNAASRALSNADQIIAAPFNLSGAGVVVGHWDGGAVSASHPDFGGRVTNYENAGTDAHATHTAGTILGSGAGQSSARGYATGATMVAFDFYGDPPSERRDSKHEHYHQHDNHSWGSDSGSFGGYAPLASELDDDGRDYLLMAIKSAGNDGQRSEVIDQNYGFDSLSEDSTGKNIMVIGATEDGGDLASFSSRGPTNDGRIKPDISANGDNLLSTVPGGGYDSYSGTSMSAPSITGMIALLSELFQRVNGRRFATDEIRAIMLHTVIDVFHPGPDYRHGWGNADALAAANLIEADASMPGSRLARGAVREAETIEYGMEVPAGAPEVKVTVTWLDTSSNTTAARVLVHDLDLVLIDPNGTTHQPWTLDPANPFSNATRDKRNTLDNIEQVLVDAPASGRWTVRVTGTSISDPDLDVQGFVLASQHPLSRSVERVAAQVPAAGTPIPGNNGLDLTFNITQRSPVRAIRFYLEVNVAQRGPVRVELHHPDGTMALLERERTSTRHGIYAVYPDLRSYAEDVVGLTGKPADGAWTVRLIDTSGTSNATLLGAMLELDLDLTVPPLNEAPIANAGADRAVNAGDSVTLDGSASSDPELRPLLYSWTQVSGTTVALNDANGAMPTFIAPTSSSDESLIFRLTVTDDALATAGDDVSVFVKQMGVVIPENQPPIARISAPTMAAPGDRLRLDANGSSDPDGDPLTFRWTQSAGPNVALEGNNAPVAELIAPETTEMVTLAFKVEVADGRGGFDSEDATIVIAPGLMTDQPPPVMEMPRPNTDLRPSGTVSGACACKHTESSADLHGLALVFVFLLMSCRSRSAPGSASLRSRSTKRRP